MKMITLLILVTIVLKATTLSGKIMVVRQHHYHPRILRMQVQL